MAEGVKRAEHPGEQCQSVTSKGQCPLKVIDGSRNCFAHGGHHIVNSIKAADQRVYKLLQWQSRVEDKNVTNAKSIREEIAILRMLIEERLNACKSNTDLMLNSTAISDMILKVDKLVNSCHRMEDAMGQLLDKQAIFQFADQVVAIISKYVDETKLEGIANEVMAALEKKSTEKQIAKHLTAGLLDGPDDNLEGEDS